MMSSPPELDSQPRTSGKALTSMILGILSFCLWIVTAIPGLIFGILGLVEINKSQGQLKGTGFAITGLITSGISLLMTPFLGILIALLLPAVQAAREAARRNTTAANMKNIVLAMHNHHDTMRTFPAAADDRQGSPVSWRTKLLPYIEQNQLHDRYDMSQPWDSEANANVTAASIAVYQSPNYRDPKSNLTHYMVLAGEETAFPPGQQSGLANFIDGTSNTILFVEVDPDRAVPWAKPEDIQFDPNNPMAGLGNHRPGLFMAAMKRPGL